MKDLLKDEDISFKTDDGKLEKMFESIAKEVAIKMKNDYIMKYKEKERREIKVDKETSSTQFRKFYDKILELNDKAGGLKFPNEYPIKISPFVKMLNSKVQYSKTRGHSGENFVILMQISIKKVDSIETLQNFKYFLESIIGFMPRK